MINIWTAIVVLLILANGLLFYLVLLLGRFGAHAEKHSTSLEYSARRSEVALYEIASHLGDLTELYCVNTTSNHLETSEKMARIVGLLTPPEPAPTIEKDEKGKFVKSEWLKGEHEARADREMWTEEQLKNAVSTMKAPPNWDDMSDEEQRELAMNYTLEQGALKDDDKNERQTD